MRMQKVTYFVYSESLFSVYHNMLEEKQARQLTRTGEKLWFLHHNLKHLETWNVLICDEDNVEDNSCMVLKKQENGKLKAVITNQKVSH